MVVILGSLGFGLLSSTERIRFRRLERLLSGSSLQFLSFFLDELMSFERTHGLIRTLLDYQAGFRA